MSRALILTREDRREMVWRGLLTCPDLGDDDGVVNHLHWLGLHITQIDRELGEMIDEARAVQKWECVYV
jgi:hypothetical protein